MTLWKRTSSPIGDSVRVALLKSRRVSSTMTCPRTGFALTKQCKHRSQQDVFRQQYLIQQAQSGYESAYTHTVVVDMRGTLAVHVPRRTRPTHSTVPWSVYDRLGTVQIIACVVLASPHQAGSQRQMSLDSYLFSGLHFAFLLTRGSRPVAPVPLGPCKSPASPRFENQN
jgi:hypothetical protein